MAICYGCAVHCHDGHDLIELYTKRNFCCDCGNSKFERKCSLYEEKQSLNARNVYNHNFAGLYCSCNKPYPSDDDDDGEMLQCVVCEDWFHGKHLDCELPSQFAEMVCIGCANRLPFLAAYTLEIKTPPCCSIASDTEKNPATAPLFFSSIDWRQELCKCNKCMAIYEDKNCAFLLDVADTVKEYESAGRSQLETSTGTGRKRKSPDEHLATMMDGTEDRDIAIHMIQGYEHLKDRLGNFLKRFAEEGRVVEKSHVDAFFVQLREECQPGNNPVKRPRLSPGSHEDVGEH